MVNNKRRINRLATTLAAFATAGILMAGCSSTPPTSGGNDDDTSNGSEAGAEGGDNGGEDVKIFMAPKFTGLAYFEVARVGGEDAAEDLGFEFEYIGSDQPEATEQIATLTNATPQEPDALVVSAIDGDAVAPALKQARDSGIKVVTYDADA